MRALITGITGFVGRYLAEHLIEQGIEVWGTTRDSYPSLRLTEKEIPLFQSDLNSSQGIYVMLQSIQPDVIFHLAGQSNVRKSWKDKESTFYANVNKTIFLLDACVQYLEQQPELRLLTVGSSEEYGKVDPSELPIVEDTPLRPMSPYGASKAAVSMLVQQYYKAYGLKVIHARPFNHIGPGQGLGFVIPDFASQIAKIEQGEQEATIKVGNLDAVRDFTDVEDIVRAYLNIIQLGNPGEIYNVCSGKGYSIESILEMLIQLSSESIEVVVDQDRLRPSEVPIFIGNNHKIQQNLKWRSTNSIELSLNNILEEHRKS
jgi:GDP-4-dehydro-6-deoxy-D-mannose reductase